MTLGEIMKGYINDHGMSSFLRDSGLSKAYAYMLIANRNNNGEPINPSVETLTKVARGLHCEFDELLKKLNDDIVVTAKAIPVIEKNITISPIEVSDLFAPEIREQLLPYMEILKSNAARRLLTYAKALSPEGLNRLIEEAEMMSQTDKYMKPEQ